MEQENAKPNLLEIIKQAIGSLLSLALVSSMAYAIGYYSYFDIDITTYLGTEDLILIFLNQTLLIFFGIFLSFFGISKIKVLRNNKKVREKKGKRRETFFGRHLSKITLGLLVLFIGWVYLYLGPNETYNEFTVIIVIIFSCSAFVLFFSESYFRKVISNRTLKQWLGVLIYAPV